MRDFTSAHQTMNTTAVKPSLYTVVVPLRRNRALVFNSVSQSLAVWDAADLQIWSELMANASTPLRSELAGFVQGGFVVNAALDEGDRVKQDYFRARNSSDHLVTTIAPTLSCNFGCHYCFQGTDKPIARMSRSVRDATKTFLKHKLEGRKSVSITWYGGEPLMDTESIWDISEHLQRLCAQRGIDYDAMMISNGYRLTVPVAKRLRDVSVRKVQITIDGDAETHDARRHLTSGRGTFEQILNNISAIAAERLLTISIRVNIDRDNENSALDLLQRLHGAGLGLANGVSVYFAPVESVAEAARGACSDCLSKTDYAEVESRLTDHAFDLGLIGAARVPKYMGLCTAMRPDSYVIVPNGDLHKCWDTVMDPLRRVGSVISASRRSDAKTEATWRAFSPFDNPVCGSCVLLPSCAGACAFKFVHPDYAEGETGKLPCPSLKFNLAEQLFQRAVARAALKPDDWCPDTSPTVQGDTLLTGRRHSFSTISDTHRALTDKAQTQPNTFKNAVAR